jgi:hypothetical protein
LPTNGLKVVVGVAVDCDSVVRDDTEVARAASEDCIEQFRIRAGIDEKSKAATKLSIAIGY